MVVIPAGIPGLGVATADVNNDGKPELFIANWWQDWSSMFLRNETEGGNWLQVQIQCSERVNHRGIGSRMNVYSGGKLGE